MKHIVVFDLDGTLLNTLEDLAASVNYALRSNHYPERSQKEVRSYLGNGIRFLMRKAAPEAISEEQFEKTFCDFKSYYMEHCMDSTCPYDGVLELMAELKDMGYTMAIVSNKLQPAVTELNEKFFSKYVSVAIGESAEVHRKPAPDSVFKALEMMGAKAEDAVYIGDSEVDMQTAQNASLPCISVLWGFRDKDFLMERGATVLVEKPAEVAGALKRL